MKFLRSNIQYLRIFFAMVGLIAIIAQFFVSAKNPEFNILNFFSYFTVLSNLFAILILFLSSFRSKKIDFFRGASVVYMLVTAIVYVILVKNSNSQSPYFVPILDSIHHVVMPLVVLLDWVFFPPKKSIKFPKPFYWLIYPIIYIAYTIMRGTITGWYPYTFLIPGAGNNYTSVFTYVSFIGLGIIFLCIFVSRVHKINFRYEK
jgi:hypothetical protein